jgi:hypothetical protein
MRHEAKELPHTSVKRTKGGGHKRENVKGILKDEKKKRGGKRQCTRRFAEYQPKTATNRRAF